MYSAAYLEAEMLLRRRVTAGSKKPPDFTSLRARSGIVQTLLGRDERYPAKAQLFDFSKGFGYPAYGWRGRIRPEPGSEH
jgi:hypothetical protein